MISTQIRIDHTEKKQTQWHIPAVCLHLSLFFPSGVYSLSDTVCQSAAMQRHI